MVRFNTINFIAIGAILLLLALSLFAAISPIYFFIVLFCWFGLTVLGSAVISWNYHLTSLNCNKTINKNQVSITFDDGPNPEFTPQVLELLSRYNARATFFCIGKHIEAYPELFQEIVEKGHTVGNHTYSHANSFGFFSSGRVVSELRQTNELIEKITTLRPNLFRPAFGITNPSIKKALHLTELKSIGWNKRSFDTTHLSEKTVLKRITNNLSKGDIVLLHDSSQKSINVLEQLLLFLQTNNIESVTVDQLLAIEPYA